MNATNLELRTNERELGLHLLSLGFEVEVSDATEGRWLQAQGLSSTCSGWFKIFRRGSDVAANVLRQDGTYREQLQIVVVNGETSTRYIAGRAFMNAIAAQERLDEQLQVASYTRNMLSQMPAAKKHDYLDRKQIQSHGARLDWHGNLVLALRDADGKIWSRQIIMKDGAKMLSKGGRVSGCFISIDRDEPLMPLIITEGFATGATLQETLGLPVIAAISKSNLAKVAAAMRQKHPNRLIIIAGDNDPNGHGQAAARAAAEQIGGLASIPVLPDGSTGTDWNDLANEVGRQEVRRQFLNSIPGASQAA